MNDNNTLSLTSLISLTKTVLQNLAKENIIKFTWKRILMILIEQQDAVVKLMDQYSFQYDPEFLLKEGMSIDDVVELAKSMDITECMKLVTSNMVHFMFVLSDDDIRDIVITYRSINALTQERLRALLESQKEYLSVVTKYHLYAVSKEWDARIEEFKDRVILLKSLV